MSPAITNGVVNCFNLGKYFIERKENNSFGRKAGRSFEENALGCLSHKQVFDLHRQFADTDTGCVMHGFGDRGGNTS